jgi:hypothetical protein
MARPARAATGCDPANAGTVILLTELVAGNCVFAFDLGTSCARRTLMDRVAEFRRHADEYRVMATKIRNVTGRSRPVALSSVRWGRQRFLQCASAT